MTDNDSYERRKKLTEDGAAMRQTKCDACADEWLDYVCCADGRLFGPCDYELCGGCCEDYGACECPCHDREMT
jgi:hypothetical protein